MDHETTLPPDLHDLAILRWPQVARLVGFSQSRIKQLEAEGRFPRRLALGTGSVGWRWGELRQWLLEKQAVPIERRSQRIARLADYTKKGPDHPKARRAKKAAHHAGSA